MIMIMIIIIIIIIIIHFAISHAILSFAWLTGYATRPVVLSYTVHTDSFTAHNDNYYLYFTEKDTY